MTQATDELLLTMVAPPRRQAGMWRGVPTAWLITAGLALAFAALLLALAVVLLAIVRAILRDRPRQRPVYVITSLQ